jgi:hypothetical protein
MDTILRPAAPGSPRPWLLQRRSWNGGRDLEYATIAHLSDHEAEDMVSSGLAYWYFGNPRRSIMTRIERPMAHAR